MTVTITINIPDETNVRLRRFIKNKYDKKKGSIGRFIGKAVDKQLDVEENSFSQTLAFLSECREKALSYRGKPSKPFSREEIYADLLR